MNSLMQRVAELHLADRLRDFEGFVVQKFRAVRDLDRLYLRPDPVPLDGLASDDPRTRAEALRFLLGVN